MLEKKEEFFTRKEICEYLHICLSCVDKLDIPKIKIGRTVRYQKSEVDAWIAKHKIIYAEGAPGMVSKRKPLSERVVPWP